MRTSAALTARRWRASSKGQRTAIVTGGAKRIGAALVRALAADGWHVLIHCNRSRAEAEALAGEIGGSIVAAELADPGAAGDDHGRARRAAAADAAGEQCLALRAR